MSSHHIHTYIIWYL